MLKYHKRKLLTLLGAFCIHFITSNIHTLPSICPYFYSYLIQFKEGTFSYTYLEVILSLVNLIHNIFIPVGVLLTRKHNITTVIGIGLILIIIAKAIFAFFINIIIVSIGLCICSVGCGLAYMPPIICLWHYYPKRKGLMTGIALSGFGFNRLVFKYLSLVIINPMKIGLMPSMERYPIEINLNFKLYLEISLVFFSFLSVISILMIHPYQKEQRRYNAKLPKEGEHRSLSLEQHKIKSCYYNDYDDYTYISYLSTFIMNIKDSKHYASLSQLIVSYPFIQLTFIFFFAMAFGTIELSSMKKFGLMNGHDETFLAFSGMMWKITTLIFFYIWGYFVDRYGFKKVYSNLVLIQILISSTCYFISKWKIGFMIYSLTCAIINSGNLTISPTAFAMIFDIEEGSMLSSIASILINTFYICRPFITNLVTSRVYFLIFYIIITLFSMLALIILCFFVEKKYNYVEHNKRKRIESEV